MSLQTKRLVRESAFVGGVLLLWTVLAAVASVLPAATGRVRIAGLIMATLYALVRGVALAEEASPAYMNPTPESVLRENWRALLAAAPWFLATLLLASFAAVFHVGFDGVDADHLTEGMAGVFESLAALSVTVGVLTVLLYAVATGTAALRTTESGRVSPE